MSSKKLVPKSYDGLMRHLRDDCGMDISGSADKRKLRTIGYYHGYKGYRFVKSGRNRLAIQSFGQIEQLYLFDMRMKGALYPWIMRIETALKNCVLESITDELRRVGCSASYDETCKHCFAGAGASKKYKQISFLSRKIALQAGREPISHYVSKSYDVPIWVLFETLTLGEFGQLYDCLSINIKSDIYSRLGMPARLWDKRRGSKRDTEDHFLGLLNSFKELRNSVAHNNVIIDARFGVRNKPKDVTGEFLGQQYNLPKIKFDELVDYVLVMLFFMNGLGFTKTDQKQLILAFEKSINEYQAKLPKAVMDRVIGKSFVLKLKAARMFVKTQ